LPDEDKGALKMKETFHRWLNTQLTELSQRYSAYSAKERRFIALLGAVMFCTCIIYALYIPAYFGLKEAENAYKAQRELLEWMQSNASRVKELASAPAKSKMKEPLPSLLADTAKSSEIPIRRLELDKDSVARLTLEKVPFNQLIGWLVRLADDYHVEIVSIAVTRTSTPGLVDASLKISE
jgi:general secretion pathway protein M